jgi:hypothetical protein
LRIAGRAVGGSRSVGQVQSQRGERLIAATQRRPNRHNDNKWG